MPKEKELQMNEDFILPFGHKKWGWRVYRTTYGDDAKWNHFMAKFQAQLFAFVNEMEGGPEHQQYIDYSIFSDVGKYENATTASLRDDFLAWRFSEDACIEQGIDPTGMTAQQRKDALYGNPRYDYFIRVDADALESSFDADDEKLWVDVVTADWPGDEDDAPHVFCDDGWPPIEGITFLDVGWNRVLARELYPDAWDNNRIVPGGRYERPPKIALQW